MKKMLLLIIGILVIGTIKITAYSSGEQVRRLNKKTVNEKYKIINKAYIGYVFSDAGKLIKEVSIKLKGKQYPEGVDRAYFEGTIEINGKTVHISSTKDKKACFGDMDAKKFYGAIDLVSSNKVKSGEVVFIETFVAISMDFKIIYGVSNNIFKEFGKGIYFKSDKNFNTNYDDYAKYRNEEPKRISLYVKAFKEISKERNNKNEFIAVKTEALDGVKDEVGQGKVIEGLKGLSPNIFNYQYIQFDKEKFSYNKNRNLIRIINGTLLYLKVNKYKDNEAEITATSWVDSRNSITKTYRLTYLNGMWQINAKELPVKIISIDDLSSNIYQNSKYKLPLTIFAVMSDKSIRSVNVIWDVSSIDTSITGSSTYYGKVEGYNSQVKLSVNVVLTEEQKRKKDISDILNITENVVSQIIYSSKLNGEPSERIISDRDEIKNIIKWINNTSIIGDAKLPADMPSPTYGIEIKLNNGKAMDIFLWSGYLIINQEFQAYQKDLIDLLKENGD